MVGKINKEDVIIESIIEIKTKVNEFVNKIGISGLTNFELIAFAELLRIFGESIIVGRKINADNDRIIAAQNLIRNMCNVEFEQVEKDSINKKL